MARSGRKNGKSLLPPSQMTTSASASAARRIVLVVHAREDQAAGVEVRLVLLALLDRGLVAVEVGVRLRSAGTAARPGRRRASDGGPPTTLRPAASSSAATYRLVWLLPQPVRTAQTATTGRVLLEHRRRRAQQLEVRACRERAGRGVHHLLVADVAVGEDDACRPPGPRSAARAPPPAGSGCPRG